MRWTWSSSTTSEIAGQTANPVCGCATLEPWSRLCPPRARKKGHARRFTVTRGATGVALDLCGRRSSGGGHFLCKQGVRLLPKTAAKTMDSYRHRPTSLEYRPSRRTRLDSSGRSAHAYGSEGWGFESLRARPGQRPFALLAAALLLTDLLTPASSPAGIERAKMSAAAAT